MKNFRFLGFSATFFSFVCSVTATVFAAEGRPLLRQNPRSTLEVSPTSDSVSSGESPHEGEASSDFHLGLGGTTWGSSLTDVPLSAWLDLNQNNSVQVALGLNNAWPLKIHTAAAYRLTIDGDENLGFHVGLGCQFLMSATGSRFGLDIFALPLFGFHGRLPGLAKIGMSVDFGPQVELTDLTSSPNFGVSAGGVSPAMGLAVHYFF